ncbi:MAG: SO2930 family diheme c-type cytochrome [Myxococcales bacterium]|nr:hypothetical protein [Myxococcota bacterium]MDW8284243.1 SO2930 family diheme c-type cytochrome [Myxococcales bacterium]
MTRLARGVLLVGGVLSVVAGCGADGPGPEVCRDVRTGPPCTKLSGFGLFRRPEAQEPAEGVWPFEPNSALFSDYTLKYRFLYLPPGTQAQYSEDEGFALPEGTILAKTFAYPLDARRPTEGIRLLETRLLIHRPEGWVALPYVWDEAQQDAVLRPVGTTIDVSWIHTDGQRREINYVVPNTNQCKECHEDSRKVLGTIGVKARHLNRDYPYPWGSENQLAAWTRLGLLRGAPPPEAAPRLPVWDDPRTGSQEQRARAWLEINCAHCHSPTGSARTSGLDLLYAQQRGYDIGVCKPPVAAGRGSGGRRYNIVPGRPDESILVFRIESTVPDIMMPETGRRLPHTEGIALVRAWIESMPGTCP